MFCLQPLKIVEVHVKFAAPSPSDATEWPMTILNERKGEIIAYFSNGDQQKLFLDGVLQRPKVTVLTDYASKNDYALDELDFGKVNVEGHRTIHVYLANETDVTAKWMLNYVKFPKKTTIGHNTTTPWETENLEKTDDPEVFEFSITEVSQSIIIFNYLILFCLFDIRVHCQVNLFRYARYQRVCLFLRCLATKKRALICQSRS